MTKTKFDMWLVIYRLWRYYHQVGGFYLNYLPEPLELNMQYTGPGEASDRKLHILVKLMVKLA